MALNLLFVIVFRMSVAGVALATIISQAVSALLVLGCLMRDEGPLHLDLRVSEMVMAVWTLLRTSSSLPLPMSRATTTLVPTEKPTNRLTSRLIRELVDPTAASAASPAQRPTNLFICI